MKKTAYYPSPVGTLRITYEGQVLTGLGRVEEGGPSQASNFSNLVFSQLDDYFSGVRQSFDLPISFEGTAFQEEVWRALLRIPYGQTASYKDLAGMVGRPGAFRAVGGANNKNPISIIIPCHRVIGADGSLVGYGGGLDMKAYLLDLEGASYREKSLKKHPK